MSCNNTKECRATVSRIVANLNSFVINTAEDYDEAAKLIKKLVDNSTASAEERKKVCLNLHLKIQIAPLIILLTFCYYNLQCCD